MIPAIRCQDLRKIYPGKPPVEAVRGLDLEVRPGECFGLLGPNGAGKTTTVEILEGLLDPSGGEVEILGLTWGRHDRDLRERLGISLQETRFADKLTVEETVRLFGSFYRKGRPGDEVISEVGLGEKSGSWVVKLSGGQRQRLAVACALVGDPDLLFLDEPTTGLDPHSRRQIWEIVRDFRRRGRTILLTTHYMDEAERLCDRVAVVDRGRVIALGTPKELIASLKWEHVVEFSLNGAEGEDLPKNPGSGTAPGLLEEIGASELPSVLSARADGPAIQLSVGEPHVAVPALMKRLAERGRTLSSLTTRHASLEDVFVSLTGRHLDE